MDIIIQSLGFTASENLKTFIEEKLGKLINKDVVIRANVTMYQGSDSNPTNQYCEIRLEVPGKDHFAKRSSDTLEKSIVATVEALQKIMRRSKEKQTDRRSGK